jgi:hypothetical protein
VPNGAKKSRRIPRAAATYKYVRQHPHPTVDKAVGCLFYGVYAFVMVNAVLWLVFIYLLIPCLFVRIFVFFLEYLLT